ncbi:UPF0158 family protein, partial [Paenibacillus durus]|uniref:UPF0158 family protein n=1 Tax=Paenibacillus durus TaxID=44251 RepID=UPI0005AAB114
MDKLTLTEAQLREIVDSYDMQHEGIDTFFNLESKEVVFINNEFSDPEDEELEEEIDEGFGEIWFRLPERFSSDGYRDMEDFVDIVSDERLRERLITSLRGGRGVFRRFKDTLGSNPEELERYYQFVDERNRERVLKWMEAEFDMEIEIIGGEE